MAILCEYFDAENLDEPLKREILKKALPKYAEAYLSGRYPKSKAHTLLCFTAKKGSDLAGFALVTYTYSPCLGEIDQLYFEPGAHEVIAPLIDQIEKTLADKGGIVVQYLYEAISDSPPPLEEAILINKGWGLKTLHMLIYYFDVFAFHPPWLEKEYSLPPGFSFLLWKDVNESEKQRLAVLQERYTFHYFVSPVNESTLIQPINSVGLIYDQTVVGWMITHTFPQEPDTIRYSALYVQEKYLPAGVAVPLLQKSIRLQQESPLQWGYFTVSMEHTEDRWLRFVKRRLGPRANRLVRIFRLSKGLS